MSTQRYFLRFGVLLLCLALLMMPFSATARQESVTFRQWASSAAATSQYGEDSWSALQATGAPDVVECGDNVLAWASATATGKDSLTLMYDLPVFPTEVNIYQTYNPGAITGIDLILADGSGTITVTDSADPGTPCPGILTVSILGEVPPVNGVVIHLDQAITGDWNEIDAVQLVGEIPIGTELSLWATHAEASSQHGQDSWSAMQATGAPNVDGCVDSGYAWAPLDWRGEADLTVYFPGAVIPTRLDIYQNYNPGAIIAVDLLLPDGSIAPIPDSMLADTSTCPAVFSLFLNEEYPVTGAIIYLDQTITEDWSEIDAVQITGTLYGEGLLNQWAGSASATSQYGEGDWSARQATGAPNVNACADSVFAWASLTRTGQDSLTLLYDIPVIPTEVTIYQTYNPGAITGIDLILADGSGTISVADSADPGTPCPGRLTITIMEGTPPVNGVIIHLDQTITGNWNEIDAVKLLGVPAE